MQNTFQKECTRDFSLIMEEAWFYGLTIGCDKLFGKNPFYPINAYHMHDGLIEVWHEEKAFEWLLNTIVKESKTNPTRLEKIVDEYHKGLEIHKQMYKKGSCETREELIKYIQNVFDSMLGFIVFYYIGFDERTEKKLREKALAVREKDSFFDDADKVIRNSLKKIYPNIAGIENSILFSEIKENNIPSPSELKKRRMDCVIIPNTFFENITLEKFMSAHHDYKFNIEEEPIKNFFEIKGQVASPGLVRGNVRIVNTKDQIGLVENGEIIISIMTVPEYLPAMKKAAAFVTDEGGITCHAAIIARELKKPCIIGTKYATKVFKTGELIEVDAIKGIVRKV